MDTDLWAIIDAVLFMIVGLGIYKFYRIAALSGLFIFI
jgi:hypothetical protein